MLGRWRTTRRASWGGSREGRRPKPNGEQGGPPLMFASSMSALRSKADILQDGFHVRFVPQADLATLDKHQLSHHPPEAAQHVEWNRPPTAMFSRSSLKRSTAASVCKTSTWMSFLDKASRVSGQTCSRSQTPFERTTVLAPRSINS